MFSYFFERTIKIYRNICTRTTNWQHKRLVPRYFKQFDNGAPWRALIVLQRALSPLMSLIVLHEVVMFAQGVCYQLHVSHVAPMKIVHFIRVAGSCTKFLLKVPLLES